MKQGIVQIYTEGFQTRHKIQNLIIQSDLIKKQGREEIFRGIQKFNYIKILDFSNVVIKTFVESEELSKFLEASYSIEDIKMPKIQIKN